MLPGGRARSSRRVRCRTDPGTAWRLRQIRFELSALGHVTPHRLPLHHNITVIERTVAELAPADGAIARHHAVFQGNHHHGLRGADTLKRPRDHGQVVRVHDGRPHLAHNYQAQVEQAAERPFTKSCGCYIKPANHLGLVLQDGQIPLLALGAGSRSATRCSSPARSMPNIAVVTTAAVIVASMKGY